MPEQTIRVFGSDSKGSDAYHHNQCRDLLTLVELMTQSGLAIAPVQIAIYGICPVARVDINAGDGKLKEIIQFDRHRDPHHHMWEFDFDPRPYFPPAVHNLFFINMYGKWSVVI